jgi:hypothetical protein
MTETITIGRRLIPREHIALIEPFDPQAQSRMRSEKTFKSRVVLLISRDSVLSEQEVSQLAESLNFRTLEADQVSTNPDVHFGVERFENGDDGFKTTRPYRSRLTWRDLSGHTQSKLLLTAPDDVLSTVIRGEAQAKTETSTTAEKANDRSAKQRRRVQPATSTPI